MDRGAWWAIVPGIAKELDMAYQLNNSNKGLHSANERKTLYRQQT